MHWLIAAFIIHIPLYHLWLHALLPTWRKYPAAFFSWIAVNFAASLLVFPTIEELSVQFFEPTQLMKGIGIALIVLGATASLWSFLTLGPKRFLAWSVLRSESNSVRETKGPFKFWPHPSYTGYLLAALGNFLSSGRYYLLIVFGLLLFMTPIIIWLEEAEMKTRIK